MPSQAASNADDPARSRQQHDEPHRLVPESVRSAWLLMVWVAAAVLLVVVARNVFVAASGVLGWALGSVLGAVLLSPLVAMVARVMPRAMAIVVVFLVLAVVGLAVRSMYVTEVRDQVDFLVERAPAVAAEIEQRDDQLGDAARDLGLVERVTELAGRLDESVGTPSDALRDTAMSVPAYVVVFILTIFFMVFGPAMFAAGVERFGGARRDRVADALRGAAMSTQRQVGASAVAAMAIGALVWIAGRALDVPAPGLFALAAAIASTVPYVGIVIGSLPMLLAGLGVAPAWQVGLVAAAVVGVQIVEATRWRPVVDRRSLYVGPAVPLVAGAIGYSVYGPGGAVALVIVAVFGLALVDEFASDDDLPTPVDDYHDTETTPAS